MNGRRYHFRLKASTMKLRDYNKITSVVICIALNLFDYLSIKNFNLMQESNRSIKYLFGNIYSVGMKP